jgi:diadenosine tetraphosphate (Ap4A) HIT family hydrolase
MNDATYPWLILVPERPEVSELFELHPADLAHLAAETTLVAKLLKGLVAADKINVAALGNVVAQLHVHVIARFAADPAWPAPVWGRAAARPYAGGEAAAMLARITAALDALASAAAKAPRALGEDQPAAGSWQARAE